MIVVVKTARVQLLDKLFKSGVLVTDDYTLKLFKNDAVPDIDFGAGDLTECAFTGYAAHNFTVNDNGGAALNGTQARLLLTGASRTWTCTAAPETVYGWYVIDGAGNLQFAERYANPHVLAIGSVHTLFPYLSLGKLIAD